MNEELLNGIFLLIQRQNAASEERMLGFMEKMMDRITPSSSEIGSSKKSQSGTIPRLNIPDFSGGKNEDVHSWIFCCRQNLEAANIPGERWTLAAGGYLRGNALYWYRRLVEDTTTGQTIEWNAFEQLLKNQFGPIDVSFDIRMKMDRLKQKNDVMEYASEFLALANQVKDMSETDQVFSFIKGLVPRIREEATYRRPKSLNEAIKIANAFENHGSHQGDEKIQDCHMDVNFIRNGRMKQYSGRSRMKTTSGIKCFRCQGFGHTQKVCPTKSSTVANMITDDNLHMDDQTSKLNKEIMECYSCVNYSTYEGKCGLMEMSGLLEGNKIKFILDTGASISILSDKFVENHGIAMKPSNAVLTVANGFKVKAKGKTDSLKARIGENEFSIEFIVIPLPNYDALLGMDFFKITDAVLQPSSRSIKIPSGTMKVGKTDFILDTNVEGEQLDNNEDILLVENALADESDIEGDEDWNTLSKGWKIESTNMNKHDSISLSTLLEQYKESFASDLKDLGTCNFSCHTIKTLTDEPIFLQPYRKSLAERKVIQDEVDKMLKGKLIRPSRSPWSSPVVLVPKKDGTKRFCIDYRKLNSVTKLDPYPVPRIDDLLDRLQGSKYFSTLDLKSGYWQIPLDEESIQKTAFTTPDGHYEFLRLPFGLKNAPAEFSRIMYSALGDLPGVLVYLDDITIHSKSMEQHLEHLENVLKRLREANLKLNPSKCEFAKTRVHVLGHWVSFNKVEMHPNKISAVQNMKEPTNVKELQQFLGLTGYYRRFVQDYARVAAPLVKLLKAETKWNFEQECQEAFNNLKNRLVSYPTLRMPELERPFLLYTDASGFAIGAILSQVDDNGNEYVCSYASRQLKNAEVHYGITEKECLAVIWAVKQFRHYLHGQQFTIITDHAALKWLVNIREANGRLARWAIYLQSFNFEIIHRKGLSHKNVDILSRPVLSIEAETVVDASPKNLDVYEDDAVLHFLKYRKHVNGLPKRQVKRVEKLCKLYTFEDDHIWRYSQTNDGTKKLKVPKIQDRHELIKKAHLLGHFGTQSTKERLQESYWWKGMTKDVEHMVDNCLTCGRHKLESVKESPAKALEVTGIFERIGMDLVVGLPTTSEGFNGILVITEYLSKYPCAYPIKSKTAVEISSKLLDYICLFGPPKEILTDQGKEFVNEVVNELIRSCGVEHKVTSAYYPRTNGLTERYNKTLVETLRKHAEGNPKNWTDWIPYVLLCYRTRVHSVTKFSPAELIFGKRFNHFEDWTSEAEGEDSIELYQRSLEIRSLLCSTRPSAKENIKKAQVTQKTQQDKRSNVSLVPLPTGCKVFLRKPKKTEKLESKYTGPFEVMKQTENGNYWLKNSKNEVLKSAYPRSRLKLTTMETSQDDLYEVEHIIQHRVKNGKAEYFVKWRNYDDSENSWVNEDQFSSPVVIEEYWTKLHDVSEDTNVLREGDM